MQEPYKVRKTAEEVLAAREQAVKASAVDPAYNQTDPPATGGADV